MIWRARTLPTPGMASSNAETFILPIVSSDWPCFRTAGKVVEPRLRLFLTSARSLRALAAFSSAAARCSGVRGGRATPGHLGFPNRKKFARQGKLASLAPQGNVNRHLLRLKPAYATLSDRSNTHCSQISAADRPGQPI